MPLLLALQQTMRTHTLSAHCQHIVSTCIIHSTSPCAMKILKHQQQHKLRDAFSYRYASHHLHDILNRHVPAPFCVHSMQAPSPSPPHPVAPIQSLLLHDQAAPMTANLSHSAPSLTAHTPHVHMKMMHTCISSHNTHLHNGRHLHNPPFPCIIGCQAPSPGPCTPWPTPGPPAG